MLTERRQIQAIVDLVQGKELDVDPDLLAPAFGWLYQQLDGLSLQQAYSLLTLLRNDDRNEDIRPAIEAIMKQMYSASEVSLYRSLAEIGPELPEIHWLWEDWIPRGMMTLVVAWPGVGKTYVSLDLARRIIDGLPTPDGRSFNDERRNVIYVDAEDFLPVVYERATQWRMNASRFYPYQRPPRDLIDLADRAHQDALIDMAYDLQPSLIIVDSLSRVNKRGENNIEDLRDVLAFMVDLPRAFDCGLLLVHHLRKRPNSSGTQPVTMNDIRGTGDLLAAARSIIALETINTGTVNDPNGPRQLKILKTNLGPYPQPMAVKFVPLPASPRHVMLTYSSVSAIQHELELAPNVDICANWLLECLAENGPVSYADLVTMVDETFGYSETTLQRARKALGDRIVDTEGPKKKGNKWALFSP